MKLIVFTAILTTMLTGVTSFAQQPNANRVITCPHGKNSGSCPECKGAPSKEGTTKDAKQAATVCPHGAAPSGCPKCAAIDPKKPTEINARYWPQRPRRFVESDKNKDGKLSKQEAITGVKDPKAAESAFMIADANKDGALSPEEFATVGNQEVFYR